LCGMSNEIFPSTMYPDESMMTSSVEFMQQIRACKDDDAARAVREKIKRQSRGLIQTIGHYIADEQTDAPQLPPQFI
jgi:hypothetical protein